MKKYFTLLILSLLSFISGSAQTTSVRAENIFRSSIENGMVGDTVILVEQKTYQQDQLIRHIFFDDSVNVSGYTFFFYDDNDRLISEEHHLGNDSIDTVVRIQYGSNGEIKEKRIYGNQNKSDFGLISRTVYLYEDSLLTEQIIYNNRSKKKGNSAYTYDENRFIIRSAFKKNFRTDNMKKSIEERVYESGKLISKSVMNQFYSGEAESYEIQYEYKDISDILEKETWTDLNNDTIVKIIKYNTTVEGRILNKAVMNAKGDFLEYLTHQHNYHLIELGVQEMYDLEE